MKLTAIEPCITNAQATVNSRFNNKLAALLLALVSNTLFVAFLLVTGTNKENALHTFAFAHYIVASLTSSIVPVARLLRLANTANTRPFLAAFVTCRFPIQANNKALHARPCTDWLALAAHALHHEAVLWGIWGNNWHW